jgi:hypothetical protein
MGSVAGLVWTEFLAVCCRTINHPSSGRGWRVSVKVRGSCGSAARLCGKASPFPPSPPDEQNRKYKL